MISSGLDWATSAEFGGADQAVCRLIVVSYSETMWVVRKITADADQSLSLSPELADIVKIRYVDLGVRPTGPGDLAALERLATALTATRASVSAGQVHSALMAIDERAELVDHLFAECRAHPVLKRIPIESRGIAVTGETARPAPPWQNSAVLVSPIQFWSEQELTTEVLSFTDHLHRAIAEGRLAGLTLGDLRALARSGHGLGLGSERPAGHHAGPPGGPLHAASPPTEGGQIREGDGAPLQHDYVTSAPYEESVAPPRYRTPPLAAPRYDPQPPSYQPPTDRGPAYQTPPPQERPMASTPPSGAAVGGPLLAPVFLVLSGEDRRIDRAGWRRGQAVLREVDGLLAAAGGYAYGVRSVVNVERAARGTRRPVGRLGLGWLLVRWAGTPAGAAGVFAAVSQSLRRELSAAPGSRPRALPTVVLYIVEAPPADETTLRCFQELGDLALIYWVAREGTALNIPPDFSQLGAVMLPDHPHVASTIVAQIQANAQVST